MKSKIVLMLVVLVLSLVLASCAAPAPAPTPAPVPTPAKTSYSWKFYSDCAPDSVRAEHIEGIIQDIEKESSGRIKIDFYPAAQLGDWRDAVGEIMRGTIELGFTGIPVSYDPRFGVLVFPALYSNFEEAATYLSPGGFMFEMASELFEAQGIKHLGTYPLGFGGIGFREIPDFAPQDPDVDKKGTKIRIAPGKLVYQLYIERWGYIPTGIPWSELYMALQTGVVDAQIGACAESAWCLMGDVLKCWVQTNYIFEQNDMEMNLDLWNSLSPEDQDIISKAFQKYSEIGFNKSEELQDHYTGLMENAGWKVIFLTDEEMARQNDIMRNDIWPALEEPVGSSLFDKMMEKFGR